MKSFSKTKTYKRILLLVLSFALSCTVSMISVFAQNSLEKNACIIQKHENQSKRLFYMVKL